MVTSKERGAAIITLASTCKKIAAKNIGNQRTMFRSSAAVKAVPECPEAP